MDRTITDQTGHRIRLTNVPSRIVSLVPSQTELLFDLGLDAEIVGITKFCVHPDLWFQSKTRVGGTKQISHAVIESLQPDLIIANKEENSEEDVLQLRENYAVWTSDIKSLKDATAMIRSIGTMVAREEKSEALARNIETQLVEKEGSRPRALYLIWKNPYMACGRDTFVNTMLNLAGFENAIVDPASRYPELSSKEIQKLNPDFIFLSSEPFPFKGKFTAETAAEFQKIDVYEVDGEVFSWYGSRLLKAPSYFQELRLRLGL